MFQSGNVYQTFKKYFPFISMLIIFVWLTVNKTSEVSDGTLIGFLGFFILLLKKYVTKKNIFFL